MSLAEELNIPHDNLRRWRKEYKAGKFNESSKPTIKSKEELEIIQLKKELYNASYYFSEVFTQTEPIDVILFSFGIALIPN